MEEEKLRVALNMRFNEEKLEELKKIAESKGIKYQTMVRNILDQFIEEHKKEEK